jgi:hypothetical protein
MGHISEPVYFDSINLETVPGLTVLGVNPRATARRDVILQEIVRTNNSHVDTAFYKERVIPVRVGIAMPTRSLAEASLDTLMGLVQGIEKELNIPQSGTRRVYTCTFQESEEVTGGGSYIEHILYFTCSDRFGYDVNPTLLLQFIGFTSGQRTDQLVLGGSAEWQAPVITYTLNSVTDGTQGTISIGNNSTGQQVSVTRDWLAGDVLEINARTPSVKVNNVDTDFTGAIPEWKPGVGYIAYSDTFTSRSISGNVRVTQRYA